MVHVWYVIIHVFGSFHEEDAVLVVSHRFSERFSLFFVADRSFSHLSQYSYYYLWTFSHLNIFAVSLEKNTMRELPVENLSLYAVTIAVTALGTYLMHFVPRTKGKNPIYHVFFLVGAGALLMLVPEWVQNELFSPGGVLLIGTLAPIYETSYAVCSIDAADDSAWLQYWVVAGTFSFATEFVDDITAQLPQAGEHWYVLAHR